MNTLTGEGFCLVTVCICSPFFAKLKPSFRLPQHKKPQVAETRASISRLADSKARTKDTKLLSWTDVGPVSGAFPQFCGLSQDPKSSLILESSHIFSLFHTPKKGSLLCRALVSPQMLLQKDFKCMYVLYIYVHTYIYIYNLQSIDMYDQPCWCSTLYFFWILLQLSWNMRVGIIEAFACLCLPVAFVSS